MKLPFLLIKPLLLIFSLAFLPACRKQAATQSKGSTADVPAAEQPAWLTRIITDFEGKAPENPPVKIYRYLYQDQPVYYITGYCCDLPGQVYDAAGKQLCQPDGGITGRGDGKCPDFFQSRVSEKLIWEDLRK